MGGGGMMKAAAKVAVVGVANNSFRSETPVRSAARQFPAVFSSSTGDADWEFTNGVDENEKENNKVDMGRVVFGGPPPTMKEAKDATAELKDIVDRAYLLSPSATGWGLACISKPMNSKIIDRVTSYGTSTVPKNALKAFTILSGNPAAQTVVASIACDPNVWSAVLQNEALVEFLQSNTFDEKSELNTDFQFNTSTSDRFSDYGELLKKSVRNIKTVVTDMVANLSDYFNDLFSVPIEEKSIQSADRDGDDISTADVAKLMGLVVMVIAIIFLKRD